jgi:hypothetical protein
VVALEHPVSGAGWGTLAAETWEAQRTILRRMMSSKGVQWFWSNYRQEFGESFRKEVAEILSDAAETGDQP